MASKHRPPRDAIMADGVEITLANGETATLLYHMDALAILERDFGTVSRLPLDIQAAGFQLARDSGEADEEQTRIADAYEGPGIMTLLPRVLAAGLVGQRVAHPSIEGATIDPIDHPDLFSRLLRPGLIQAYAEAFTVAFMQAFATGEEEEEAGPTEAAAPPSSSSRSRTGGGSPSRTRTSSRASSGG